MAYKKTNWQDRQVEKPMTFTMTNNDNGTITLTPYPGVVNNEGTKVTASRMNNIENGIESGSVPTGCILPFGGTKAPAGYLMCDGSAVNRSTYLDLYSVIGTAYGQGDNSTTFNLPDMRSKVPAGIKAGSSFSALGKTLGEETHKLTFNEMPIHKHPLTSWRNPQTAQAQQTTGFGFTNDDRGFSNIATDGDGTAYTAHNFTGFGTAGGDVAHNNIQPSLVVNYIIKT